ncbi:MAG: hypothetical protein HOK21_25435 [Rhodospirillaceae bacterium]|nr:hypothetical protein [Rhodospirillaceae bacterium]MBT5079193.1 hypothetical protein [Rhodospirillaceae bacterium]MBT5527441.1 hypothetical protein [Rhodospirillaceae bacterium]MBT6588741.1 hypothetical protein [Rhodospirillaceae bacterium]MBT6986955.1 hypothetical protein [Rhodospirillaceae bacterium]
MLAAFLLEMESGRFSKALIEKFAAPNSWTGKGSAIPKEKFRFTENEDYNTVFDLHKDLPGYEITPHPDVASKIVTFLFYFTTDSSIAKHGTALCKPKDPDWVDDRSVPKSLPLRALLDRFLINGYGPYQKDAWHPWEDFDIVKVAEAHPNSFLSFAPNFSSYHGVRLDIRKDNPIQERLTLRGFIRAGSNSTNYMHDYGNGIMRRAFFRFSRFVTGRNKSALNSMRGTHD